MTKPKAIAVLNILSNIDGAVELSTNGTKPTPGAKWSKWSITWIDGVTVYNNGTPPSILSNQYTTDGTYNVIFMVTDTKGNSSSAQLMLIVKSPPPPIELPLTVTCPSTINATSSDGNPVVVNYPNPAVASGGTPPYTITYNPPSGSSFALGPTTVNVLVTDMSNPQQSASCTFQVNVTQLPANVIAATNIHYMGAIRLPTFGGYLQFTMGGLAVRRINGKTRFIILQDFHVTHAPAEYESPVEFDSLGNVVSGTPLTPDYQSTPQAQYITNWGLNNDNSPYDFYHGIVGKWYDANGNAFNDFAEYGGGGGTTWNCFYENGKLHIMYGALYGNYHEWGHMFCTLDNPNNGIGPVSTAYGPFNIETPGNFPYPTSPLSSIRGLSRATFFLKTHDGGYGHGGAGSGAYQQEVNPGGPTLYLGFNLPDINTPQGYPNFIPTLYKGLNYYTLNGIMNPADGSLPVGQPIWGFRHPNYPYPYESSQGAHLAINPNLNGGIGTWGESDATPGMVYINTGTKHGYLIAAVVCTNHKIGSYQTGCTFGGETVSHSWYAAAGNPYCDHGCIEPVAITGPVTTKREILFTVYDPAKIEEVKNGTRVDYTLDPEYRIYPTDDMDPNILVTDVSNTGATLCGITIDETNNMIYILMAQIDTTTPGLTWPVIYAFQVR